MTKKAKIRIGIIAVVVILVALAIAKKKGAIGKDTAMKVSTEQVQKRTIVETVSANGKIQPETEVKITPYISGEVVGLYVKEGQEVKEGDLLAKIDPEIYISSYDRSVANLNTMRANEANAQARLVQAKSQFANAEESYKRNKQLYEQQVISQADWDAAQSAYSVAKAEVDAATQNLKAAEYTVNSAVAGVKEAKENLTKTTITSPTDGVVSKLSIEKGERVAGASQFSAGTELMRIANLNLMEANVEVNENDIMRVKLGDTALIEVDAYLNKKFKGIVTEIATSANTTGVSADQVTNFNIKIRLLKDSYQDLIPADDPKFIPFRPGMSATVDIQTETVNDVLTVPIQAVTTRADTTGRVLAQRETTDTGATPDDNSDDENGNKRKERKNEEMQEYVFLYDNGKAVLQKVKSGVQDNTYIQIVDGLSDGQEVIVAPYSAVTKILKNGDEVKKVKKEELFKES
jgi:HlyD family secretion protein